MGTVLTFLGSLAFKEILLLSVIWTILYLVVVKLTENDLCQDIQEIKETKKGELYQYIHGELSIIESQSLGVAREILKEYPQEYINFSLVLERSLYFDTMEKIKTTLKINGYHDKKGADLDEYIRDKALVLLSSSRKLLNDKIYLYPHLEGTDNRRFTSEDSAKFFEKIVKKSMELKIQQNLEIKKCKERYSIIYQLNIIKKIIDKFSKESK